MKKTSISRRSYWCPHRSHPLYHLFTHLCTKYLRPVKSRLSHRTMMTQHQVHGALVLLYCTLIWAAIGILFNFGKRLFSRDWSMLRATLTHFFPHASRLCPTSNSGRLVPLPLDLLSPAHYRVCDCLPHHLDYFL